jgi:hypothetical protein
MKRLFLLLGLFFPLNAAIAQSVTLGTISKTTLCLGDTVWVPYSSSGSFAADNFFAVQLSDANGDFTTFTYVGHATSALDLIPVVIGGAGNNWVLRVIATDPYTISSNTSPVIQIVSYPSPKPGYNLKQTWYLGATAFLGDTINFTDGSIEGTGSKFEWSFGQDANIFVSIDSSPKVSYSSVGKKSGSLSVTNSTGCSTSKPFQLQVLTCNPVIPDSGLLIVTGAQHGSYPFVWVKAGGSYTPTSDNTTVFVERGGVLSIVYEYSGIYFVKAGASFSITDNNNGYTLVVLAKGSSVNIDNVSQTDTLYCNDLQFDYSQVTKNDVKLEENPLQIQNTANGLQLTNEGEEISASVVNPLGVTLFSRTERDMLAIDYSALASGVYFVIITSGNQREMRKIAVVH